MSQVKTKQVTITRTYTVYDGPELPYIDEQNLTITFDASDTTLANCIDSPDYDEYKRAVMDLEPIVDAIDYALLMHNDGELYESKEDYDFSDYDGCVLGNVYYESDLEDEYPETHKIVTFDIVRKST
jgi:hypothetical protein